MKPETKKTSSISSIIRRNKKKEITHHDFIIYYSKQKDQLRYQTDIKVLKNHVTKKGDISSLHPTHDLDISKLNNLKTRADKFIENFFDSNGTNPESKLIEEHLNKPNEIKQKTYEGILDYIEDFIKYKKVDHGADRSETIYYSMEDALNQYQIYLNKDRAKNNRKDQVIKFNDLDQDFFIGWITFLLTEKIDERNLDPNTNKGMISPTVIQRMKSFITFIEYCVVQKDMVIPTEKIKIYIKRAKKHLSVQDYEKDHLTLSQIELQYLYEFDINLVPKILGDRKELNLVQFSIPSLTRFRDNFIFSALQGQRMSDMKTMKEVNIKSGKKRNIKTKDAFDVNMNPVAQEIIERYDYNLHVIDQHYNKALKIIGEAFFKWFKPIYEKKYKKDYSLTFVTYNKWGKFREEEKEVFKFSELTSHTARRTFLTLMLNPDKNVNIKTLMKMVGHKKIETTMKYYHPHEDNKVDYSNLIDITKHN